MFNFIKSFKFLLRKNFLLLILFFCFFGMLTFFIKNTKASSVERKLPYDFNESFVVSQGYNSPPTHINKDKYALDFTKNACEAYGKNVISADSGKVLLVEDDGYNGGYGSQVLIINNENIVTRYAHLVSHSIPLKEGDTIVQGDLIGKVGNTGLALGFACKEHPGSHLHFAVYTKLDNGNYEAKNPEPISKYTDIKEGNWYLSDNKKETQQLGSISSIINNIAQIFSSNNSADKNSNDQLISDSKTDISNDLTATAESSSSQNTISNEDLNFQNTDNLLSNETTTSDLYDVNQSDNLNDDLQNFTTSSSDEDLNNQSDLISNNADSLKTDTSTTTASSTDLLNNDSETSTVSTSETNIDYSNPYNIPSSSQGGSYGGVSETIPDYAVSTEDNSNQQTNTSSSEAQSDDTLNDNSNSSSTEILPIDNSTNTSSSDNTSDTNSSSTENTDQNLIDNLNNASSSNVNNSSTTIDIGNSSTTTDIGNSSTTTDFPQTESSTESSPYNFSSLILSPTPIMGNQIAYFNWNTYNLDFLWNGVLNVSGTYDGMKYSIFDLTDQSSSLTQSKLASLIIGGGVKPLWSGTSTQYSYAISSGGDHHFYILASDNDERFSYFDQHIYVPEVFSALQPINSLDSHSSWYDDNWYNLGTGFYGTLHSLTLEGYVNDSWYSNSHISIQEFLDSNYTQLNNQFVVSDDAPFTNEDKKVTISGLNIFLQPNKYYRLLTDQNYQNRSVILKGTDEKGEAMWDAFVYGTGIVRMNYTFYPYISWGFQNNFPPLLPPNSPPNLSLFYNLGVLRVSWSQSTDPDTDSSLISYEYNVSDSMNFDDANWKSVSKDLFALLTIDISKQHYIAVRAVDDFGNKSLPSIAIWNPPLDIPTSTIPIAPLSLPPNSPPNLSLFYNSGVLRVSWSQSTDPDTDSSLISYEYNVSDSMNFDDANWKSVSKDLFALLTIDISKQHYIAVRAVDDFGNKSLPSIAIWNPPLP